MNNGGHTGTVIKKSKINTREASSPLGRVLILNIYIQAAGIMAGWMQCTYMDDKLWYLLLRRKIAAIMPQSPKPVQSKLGACYISPVYTEAASSEITKL